MQTNEAYIANLIEVIKQKAQFMERRGFELEKKSEYTFLYSLKHFCSIAIYFGKYSDVVELYVRFENKGLSSPEQYSIGWFRKMKRFETEDRNPCEERVELEDRLNDVFMLFEYLRDNFDDITNIVFCRRTQHKINDNFKKGIW